jgi:diguanylate cyclase (GGDEF)-like protein
VDEQAWLAVPARNRRLALGRRMSVWHFLVTIALLPTLGLPALAGALASERLGQASTANLIEHELMAIESIDQLRGALTDETVAGSLTLISKQIGLPMEMFSGQLGWQRGSLADARAGTDRAVAATPQMAPFTSGLAEIGTRLPTLRATIDRALASGTQGLGILAVSNAGYQQIADLASEAEQALAQHVGTEGATTTRLLINTHSFDAICAVTVSQARRVTLFYRSFLAGSRTPADSQSLDAESAKYRVLTAQLGKELDPQSAQAWNQLIASDDFRVFDAAVVQTAPDFAALTNGTSIDLSLVGTVLPTARAAMQVVNRLSTFLQYMARRIATLARTDANTARNRALWWLAGTGLVIFLTTVALFVIGGALRGRLSHLAKSAERLSAGHLEPVVVQGPRELAATSEALNAAVATLRHIEEKALILASGDLESPELEQPAPGPLGAAIDASVSRIVTAVREREELQIQLAHQASHDVLTGLPNRAELDRALTAALARAERGTTPLSVLFVDLDGFKACNDRYGHAAGDRVLKLTAERLHEAVRPGDVVARLGGDEFIVIIEGAAPGPDTVQVGERIVAAVSQPISYQGNQITIGASIGLAGCDRGQATTDQLLSEADAAVYQAKAYGRGRVVVHDERIRASLHAEQALQEAVRNALDNGEFVLHYQPVINLSDMRACGLEALIRWQKPDGTVVMPADFIPAIETGDLILEVDRWVLHEATTQLTRWSQYPGLKDVGVWVNISGRHLTNASLVQDVEDALERAGLAASRLVIEITETASIDNPHAVSQLQKLAQLGVRLALDDFGTGHTSMSQLLNLPIHILKLDRSLLGEQPARPGLPHGSPPISRLVGDMARGLGLIVVAEGVERVDQLGTLQTNQCDHAQGYLFTRPLEPAQVPSWASRASILIDTP